MSGINWEQSPTPERIAEVIALTKGRGSNDDESCVNDCQWQRREGFITAYFGEGSRAARFLTRCGSAVTALGLSEVEGHTGVHVKVRADAFRGLEYAFRNLDAKGPPMTEAQKAKAFGGAA